MTRAAKRFGACRSISSGNDPSVVSVMVADEATMQVFSHMNVS